MGTDLLGRDVLSRVLTGGRLTLGIGLLSVIIGFVVGCSMASVGVIGGRYVDGLIMRLVDVLLAFPSILLAIAVIAALGQGVPQLMVAIGVAQIGNFARLLRSRLVAVQQADFIVASQAIGAGRSRILLRHLLPNALTPVLVYSPLALATAISSIASLGFLGLGPSDPSTPEWGSMLSDAAQYLRQGPQLLLFPGAAIVATILGFNLLGDALREAVDPRRRT
jgi:peptide/nickel transport system permease protein